MTHSKKAPLAWGITIVIWLAAIAAQVAFGQHVSSAKQAAALRAQYDLPFTWHIGDNWNRNSETWNALRRDWFFHDFRQAQRFLLEATEIIVNSGLRGNVDGRFRADGAITVNAVLQIHDPDTRTWVLSAQHFPIARQLEDLYRGGTWK